MIKSIGKLTLMAILAAAVVGIPVKASAQTNATVPAVPVKAKRFSGKITAVDKTAKTVMVENKTQKRTFEITSGTKLMTRDGKPAVMDQISIGDDVSGSYTETDGKLIAKMLRFGPKPAPAN